MEKVQLTCKAIKISNLKHFTAPNNMNSDRNGEAKEVLLNNKPHRRISSQCGKKSAKYALHEEFQDDVDFKSYNTRHAEKYVTMLVLTHQSELGKTEAEISDIVTHCIQEIFHQGKNAIKFAEYDFYCLAEMIVKQLTAKANKDAIIKYINSNFKHAISVEDAIFGKMHTSNSGANTVESPLYYAHAFSVFPHNRQTDAFVAIDDVLSFLGLSNASALLEEKAYDAGSTMFLTFAIDFTQLLKNLEESSNPNVAKIPYDKEAFRKYLSAILEHLILSNSRSGQHAFFSNPNPSMVSAELLSNKNITTDDNAFDNMKRIEGHSDVEYAIEKYVNFVNQQDRAFRKPAARFYFTADSCNASPQNCIEHENLYEFIDAIVASVIE